jgi:hypothetical protein
LSLPADLDAPADQPKDAKGKPCPKTSVVEEVQPEAVQTEFGISIPDGPNAFGTEKVEQGGPLYHWMPEVKGPGQFFASAEYLLWWVKDTPLPIPLLTSGTAASQGILGAPGTTSLVGDSLGYGPLAGGRFSFGFETSDHDWTIVATAFVLETGAAGVSASSDAAGNPVLARPYFNTTSGAPASALVSFPGSFSGSAALESTVDLFGVEVNALRRLSGGGPDGISLLVGFRYLSLEENMSIAQASTALPGGVFGFNGASVTAPAMLSVVDGFDTRNKFFGGQAGTQITYHPGHFFVDLTGKLGIGNTYESVSSAGVTTLSGTGAPASSVPSGLYALAGQGITSRSAFTLVPEFDLNVGVDLTCNLRIFVGYTFLYWDDVVRPANQINYSINPANVPSSLAFGTGGPGPVSAQIHNTDFWAQGLNIGFTLRY